MIPLSVAIITRNEAHQIRNCLESIHWADEIVLVDACSEDETVAIASEYHAKIFIRSWQGYASQKRFALENCLHEWVLSIDADERVLLPLKEEIQQLLQSEPTHDGYQIARRSYFLGKWIQHAGWYPGYQTRLFRKSRATVSERHVHEGFLIDGTLGTLKHDLDHFSHLTLFDSLEKLNRYSTLEAFDRLSYKKKSWRHFIFNPLSEFWRKYIALGGFRDGAHGFLLSWISAFLKMTLFMKIWRLQQLAPDQLEQERAKHL